MNLQRIRCWDIIVFASILLVMGTPAATVTDSGDIAALEAFKEAMGIPALLAGWKGDPCDDAWEGVLGCTDANNATGTRRVTVLALPNNDLEGVLPPELGQLAALTTLDLAMNARLSGVLPVEFSNLKLLTTLSLQRCNLSGPIPAEYGALRSLEYLILNDNRLSGALPASLGNLTRLSFFDITSNAFSGPVPVSPGLDDWSLVKHLHMSNNFLTTLPAELGRLRYVQHLLMDNNTIAGQALPPELSNISSLWILRVNNNKFTGGVPPDYTKIVNLSQLSLANCSLTGTIPPLNGFVKLLNLDLSLNSLTGAFPPAIGVGSTMRNVQTINVAGNQLSGTIPATIAGAGSLQVLDAGNNFLTGSVPPLSDGNGTLLHVSLINNKLTGAVPPALLNNSELILQLSGNPVCVSQNLGPACQIISLIPLSQWTPDVAYCTTQQCSRGQAPSFPLSKEKDLCICVTPVVVFIRLLAPPFSTFTDELHVALQQDLAEKLSPFVTSGGIVPDQILSQSANETDLESNQHVLAVMVFPPDASPWSKQDAFRITDSLVTQKVQLVPAFGPYSIYDIAAAAKATVSGGGKSSNLAAVLGSVFGAMLVVAIVAAAIIVFLLRKLKRQKDEMSRPFYSDWGRNLGDVSLEGLNLRGVKYYPLDDLQKATNNFNNVIGEGGYGAVYKGVLDTGELAAIKRAKPDSHQGGKEFRNEIELLSGVRHKNLMVLLGFCKERGEQLLVYEFISNGDLFQHLHGKIEGGKPLTWEQRMGIAVDSARGLCYLHNEISPPIIHRDIKSTNILIDDKFRARVADFGLSKLAPDGDEEGGSSVDTKVKGTLGYLDPEYFLTDRLTEKSDVYSFGVVIMELVSGRRPIQENEHIIRHINMQVQLSGLKDVVDPTLGKSYLHEHAARMVDLALKCCHENPKKRPTMQDVLLELESIRGMLAHTSSAFDDESGGDNKSSLGYLEYHHAGTRGLNPYSSSSIISDSSHSSSHPTSAEQVNYVSPRQVGEHLIDISGSFQLSLVTPK